jgi:hypothetical protein
MSFKEIESLIHAFEELAAAIVLGDASKIKEWITKIEEDNNENLEMGKEYKNAYLTALHGSIRDALENIKRNPSDRRSCSATIASVLDRLRDIEDQAAVRDAIIKEVIHPIMKGWGWRKNGRSFITKEGEYTKKLLVYSSRTNDYYEVDFRFEMEVEGNGVSLIGKTIRRRDEWYHLTPGADLENIKAQIVADLNGPVKDFFVQYH